MRKKRIVVLLMALLMLVMSAAPALAVTDRPRPLPFAVPPGQVDNEHENRPAHAETPITGPDREGWEP
jgi:hypothetical protein